MRDVVIIGVACLIAIGVGAWLYLSEPGSAPTPNAATGVVMFSVLEEGKDAGSITERKNFRIKNSEQLAELWRMINGTAGNGPSADFTTQEVLAVFDGTHASGGYGVDVVTVEDTASARTVVIRRTVPGETCVTTSALESPYVVIALASSPLPIQKIEQTEVIECD